SEKKNAIDDMKNNNSYTENEVPTLYSRMKYDDYYKASFNFMIATQDNDVLSRYGPDIEYGNGEDEIDTQMNGGDNECFIADLGVGHLADFTTVWDIPSRAVWEEEVKATLNHIYVVHVKENMPKGLPDQEYYAKFKVVDMQSNDWIKIDWQCTFDGQNFIHWRERKPIDDDSMPVLLSRYHEGYDSSIYSFNTGIVELIMGEEDMEYGNGIHNLDVRLHGGQENVIKDLGLVKYDDVKSVPSDMGEENVVFVYLNHTYVIHVQDSDSNFYVKLKIVEEKPDYWIQFKWEKIGQI
ncbi:MAG: hypothetical protein CVT47_01240, partial [Thermoplasmata archaeon HGW-Thermoplasmata-2]